MFEFGPDLLLSDTFVFNSFVRKHMILADTLIQKLCNRRCNQTFFFFLIMTENFRKGCQSLRFETNFRIFIHEKN